MNIYTGKEPNRKKLDNITGKPVITRQLNSSMEVDIIGVPPDKDGLPIVVLAQSPGLESGNDQFNGFLSGYDMECTAEDRKCKLFFENSLHYYFNAIPLWKRQSGRLQDVILQLLTDGIDNLNQLNILPIVWNIGSTYARKKTVRMVIADTPPENQALQIGSKQFIWKVTPDSANPLEIANTGSMEDIAARLNGVINLNNGCNCISIVNGSQLHLESIFSGMDFTAISSDLSIVVTTLAEALIGDLAQIGGEAIDLKDVIVNVVPNGDYLETVLNKVCSNFGIIWWLNSRTGQINFMQPGLSLEEPRKLNVAEIRAACTNGVWPDGNTFQYKINGARYSAVLVNGLNGDLPEAIDNGNGGTKQIVTTSDDPLPNNPKKKGYPYPISGQPVFIQIEENQPVINDYIIYAIAGDDTLAALSITDGGVAVNQRLSFPSVVTRYVGNTYLLDNGIHHPIRRIIKLTNDGKLHFWAGNGNTGSPITGNKSTISVSGITDLEFDKNGNCYLAQIDNPPGSTNGVYILKIDAITDNCDIFAGNGTGDNSGNGGNVLSAGLYLPRCFQYDKNGNKLYFIANDPDADIDVIRYIDLNTNIIDQFFSPNETGILDSNLHWFRIDFVNNFLYVNSRSSDIVKKDLTHNTYETYIPENGPISPNGTLRLNAHIPSRTIYDIKSDGKLIVLSNDSFARISLVDTIFNEIAGGLANTSQTSRLGDDGLAKIAWINTPGGSKDIYYDNLTDEILIQQGNIPYGPFADDVAGFIRVIKPGSPSVNYDGYTHTLDPLVLSIANGSTLPINYITSNYNGYTGNVHVDLFVSFGLSVDISSFDIPAGSNQTIQVTASGSAGSNYRIAFTAQSTISGINIIRQVNLFVTIT